MKTFIMLVFSALITGTVFAQENSEKTEVKELKWKLNEDGNRFIKATFTNQVWVRYTQDNPGTTIDGYPESRTFDIGLRRTRMQFFGQLSDRVFFYTQIGQNNLAYNSPRKQGIFIHDALGELKIWNNYLSAGTGLTAWGGLSRYASPSVGSLLSLDAPLYQQATNDVNDQFLRKYSLYIKGKVGRVDYRFALAKPMMLSGSPVQGTAITENSLFSPEPPKPQFQGYVMYQFFEKESNQLPYNVGSYLGKKRVLNIGAGFITQHNAMWHTEQNGADTVHNNLRLFAADVFYEQPLNPQKENAITVYVALNFNDYGKNYVRNLGVMNHANGVNVQAGFNGAGNAFPMIGTGTTGYAQFGYLFRKDLLRKLGTLQLYAASQYSRFQLLKDPMQMYELGFNWLIDGQHAKVSFNYQSRPVYHLSSSGDRIAGSRKGMFVMQFQVGI